VLRAGDSLASLEAETGVLAQTIAQANGVPWPGVKSCAWSRDIDAWVLAVGGRRAASNENVCDASGFTTFSKGNVIYLPPGARPAPLLQLTSSSRWPLVGVLVLLAAGAAAMSKG
jgi:hypothetical protein